METFVSLLSRALVVLFIVGAFGCLFVIPLTAVELLKALFIPDEAEPDGTSQPRAVS